MGFKPPGSGRKKGTPNKATAEIKALAQVHAPAAIKELARLALKAKSEQARVAAIRELIDRGYGKATQSHEHSGPGGGPIQTVDLTSLTADELSQLERTLAKASLAGGGESGDSEA